VFVRLKRLVSQIAEGIKLVICRKDLPENPRWQIQGYPYANCWEIDELFSEAVRAGRDSELYREVRRIWWECLPSFEVVPALIDEHFATLPIEEVVNLFRQGHEVRVLTPYSASPRSLKKPPEFARVVDVKEYEFRGYLVRIETHYGKEIFVTPNHVIPVYRNGRLRFVQASEIREGDRVIIDFDFELPHGNEVELVPLEVVELLGYMLSEGYDVHHYTKKYKGVWYTYPTFVVVNFDERIGRRIMEIAKRFDSYAYARQKRIDQIRLGLRVANIVRELGIERLGKSSEKRLPMKLFWLPKQHLQLFLRALYSGDGCVKTERSGKSVVVDYATASRVLARQLYWLLRYLGFKYVRVVKDDNLYRLQLSVEEDIRRFVESISFVQEEKNERLRKAIEEGRIAKTPRLKRTVPVRKVELVEYNGKVYDLAVEKPHVYFAGFGILVHNSYWRLLGKYRGSNPFFEVYEVAGATARRVEDREEWVLKNILASGFAHGIVPPEAREYTYKVYREIYGHPVAR